MSEILKERKIGEYLHVGCSAENNEIGLFLAGSDVSASVSFTPEEWTNFNLALHEINQILKVRKHNE